MSNVRLIARLDIKGPNLIKGVHLEGLRVVGDPQAFAERYYREGIDELIYMDIVASLYGRNNLTDIVRHTAEKIFVPLTVGGGIRSTDDVRDLLRAGADKIAINTAATRRPELVSEIAGKRGDGKPMSTMAAKRRAWMSSTGRSAASSSGRARYSSPRLTRRGPARAWTASLSAPSPMR